VDSTIETGRWYDIKVELAGGSITCYLDGKRLHDVQAKPTKALYASSTLSADGKEVILKVVNTAAGERAADVRLNGLKSVAKGAKGWVLTAADAMDENSLEEPFKVAPKAFSCEAAPRFTQAFPGNSVTVLRVPVPR
jgi:alpha-L-arabinofuranosidase